MSPVSKPKEAGKNATHKEPTEGGRLAAVLLRGLINTKHDIRQALVILRLRKKHVCVVLSDTATNRGMLEHCKDYITWGEVDDVTVKELDSKRAKKDGKVVHYHLNSPRGGFERGGIKKTYAQGGALGYRAHKIGDLIRKMV
ncbi:MAG: uL30 family ribosomal protein [Nanoarchaeota archaeon]